MKYKCVTKCYFNGRLYEVDEVVDFEDGARVPSHFRKHVPLDEQIKQAAEQGAPEKLEDMNIMKLKSMAKLAGYEFPNNVTKQELIDLIRAE